MAKVVEVASFPASTAYLENPLKYANSAYALMHEVPGYHRAIHGVEVEDKETGWALVGWESVDHHIRMSDHPNHPAILADFFQACIGTPTIAHVETDGNFKPFDHPVLQLVNIKLKNPENKDRLETLLEKIKARYAGRSTWGAVKEEAGTYKLFTGWQTVE
ncbi:hypothetical protein MPER_00341, partial [Moniliophthora perniciosa FA553]